MHHHNHHNNILKKPSTNTTNNNNDKPITSSVSILSLDISHVSPTIQFLILASGVFICFLIYGVCQELITSNWKIYNVHLGWFLTFTQCGCYSFLVWISGGGRTNNNKSRQTTTTTSTSINKTTPLFAYVLIGGLSMLTIGLSNSAVEFLSYSTQVAFKSSKPVPVQILGVCILGKRYTFIEYLATFILTAGLILFALSDSKSDTYFDPIGVVLICSALVVDGFIGNVQQRVFKDYDLSPTEMIMKTKGFASLFAGIVSILNGQMWIGITFTFQHWEESLFPILCYCVSGVVGENFVMALMKRFGALAAVITTSVRKMFTVALSFLIFQHTFTISYAVASLLVGTGVGMHVYLDHSRSSHHHTSNNQVLVNTSNKKEIV
jgi:adenosine 3'-phospho 5'-phosphosulfate transporter B3